MAFVLIVDDELAIRELMRQCLEKVGHRVLMAEGAETANELLRDHSFDVVVADIHLPGDSGIELLKSIRNASSGPRMIMMTGDSAVEYAAEAVRHGATDYLIKPVPKNAICRSVETAARLKAMDDRCRQLEQENRAYQQDLEQLVARRTEELQASNDALSETLEKLRAAYEVIHQQERLHTLEQLASSIAHDFNNALMPILGLTEHLLQEMKDHDGLPDQVELLGIVMAAANDAKAIVQRLQAFYKPEQDISVAPVALGQVVDDVVHMMAPVWLGEGKSIRVSNEIKTIPDVAANAAQCSELLTNLLLNAAQAIGEKGKITISAIADRSVVTLRVCDDGCGMSPETVADCMNLFFTTKAENGTGLGLAMCANIARQYGGHLSLESKEGEGTCVAVALPVFGERSTPEPTPLPVSYSNLRILVIDDDENALIVLQKFLAAEGHEAETFQDVETGLERLASAPFDILLTDRAMMEMSGDLVAKRAKQLYPEIPVILVTGLGDVINARGIKIPDVDLVVSKPVTREILNHAIATVLQDRDNR